MGIMTGSGEEWEDRVEDEIEKLRLEIASLKRQLARAIEQDCCTLCGKTLEEPK